jgi:hypothetical protein
MNYKKIAIACSTISFLCMLYFLIKKYNGHNKNISKKNDRQSVRSDHQSKNQFDHHEFIEKHKPIVNNLKQLHFYKRNVNIVKKGNIHGFNDTYE